MLPDKTGEPNPRRVYVLGRATGKLRLALEWDRAVSKTYGPCQRSVIFDLADVEGPVPTEVWDSTSIGPGGGCLGRLVASSGDTGLIFKTDSTTSLSMGADLSMGKVVAVPHPQDGGNALASPSVLATNNMGGGFVYRMPFGSNQAVTVPTPQGVSPLFLGLVEGNDVFARSNYGTNNWMQWYRTDPDGQARLVLSRPAIQGLQSDGAHLFWLEASGKPGGMFWPQPKMEVWSSPYSQDLDAVRANARMLADVSGLLELMENPVAFNGFYAYAARNEKLVVVRETDGALQTVSVGPGRIGFVPVYITGTELWVHVGKINSTEGALVRIKLAPWPS
ncbi:MAG: hypothetical protein U0174_15265 [Polyangiaceae bacterium]